MAGYKDMEELFRLTKKSFINLIREDEKKKIEARGEKARSYGAFPGNQPGNGSATKSATGWDFQKGSSICSVTSTNPSRIFPAPLLVSVAGFSRSQPFCLPYSGNIRGLEK